MPEIIVKYEDKVIERIVTEKKRISIGRTNDNDIMLENRGVSRKHAMIEFNDRGAIVMDNESLNGTFVNNRKVTEEMLHDADVITIGKYSLVYQCDTKPRQESESSFDGTMILNTRKQREMIANDRQERNMVQKYGGSVLVGLDNVDFSEHQLDRDVTTIGKAKFVHVQAKGFWLSGIQAKVVRDKDTYTLVNLGKEGKTKLNGEAVSECELRNGDIISVGKSSFKFVEGK